MSDLHDQLAGVHEEFEKQSSLEGCVVACVEPSGVAGRPRSKGCRDREESRDESTREDVVGEPLGRKRATRTYMHDILK